METEKIIATILYQSPGLNGPIIRSQVFKRAGDKTESFGYGTVSNFPTLMKFFMGSQTFVVPIASIVSIELDV